MTAKMLKPTNSLILPWGHIKGMIKCKTYSRWQISERNQIWCQLYSAYGSSHSCEYWCRALCCSTLWSLHDCSPRKNEQSGSEQVFHSLGHQGIQWFRQTHSICFYPPKTWENMLNNWDRNAVSLLPFLSPLLFRLFHLSPYFYSLAAFYLALLLPFVLCCSSSSFCESCNASVPALHYSECDLSLLRGIFTPLVHKFWKRHCKTRGSSLSIRSFVKGKHIQHQIVS